VGGLHSAHRSGAPVNLAVALMDWDEGEGRPVQVRTHERKVGQTERVPLCGPGLLGRLRDTSAEPPVAPSHHLGWDQEEHRERQRRPEEDAECPWGEDIGGGCAERAGSEGRGLFGGASRPGSKGTSKCAEGGAPGS